MPVAYNSSIVINLWTGAAVATELDSRLVAIGYTRRFLSTAGNPCWGVYSIASPTVSNPPLFLRFRVTSLNATALDIDWGVGDAHPNINSEAVSNISEVFEGAGRPTISWTANEQIPLKFETFNSPEIKLVSLFRSDNNSFLFNVGVFFPLNRTPWWVSGNKPYGFITRNPECTLYRTYRGSPVITNTTVPADFNIAFYSLTRVNNGGTKDIKIGDVTVVSQGGRLGTFSSDFGLINSQGFNTRSEQITVAGATYITRSLDGEGLLIRIN
jgi:hypothetical protein